jgi:Domain of unknown function (DUF1841)
MFIRLRRRAGVEEAMPHSAHRPGRAGSGDSSAAFAATERPVDNRHMFAPSSDDVRGFFVEAARKRTERLPLTPLEAIAADWIAEHPEYTADLADAERARAATYAPESGRENPFLHLSMHLSISEQVSIDQPRGIRQACELLAARLGSMHAAQHEAMECLGQMLWEAQRSGKPPDGDAYIDCVRRRATRA